MKRSEYISRVVAEASRPGGSIILPGGMSLTALFSKLPAMHTSEQLADVLADYEEAFLHVKWDPEEPELPKSITKLAIWQPSGTIIVYFRDGSHRPIGYLYDEFKETVGPDFCDAYNRLQSGELTPLPAATEEILKLIQERDDLAKRLARFEGAEIVISRLRHFFGIEEEIVPSCVGVVESVIAIVQEKNRRMDQAIASLNGDLREWFDKEAS